MDRAIVFGASKKLGNYMIILERNMKLLRLLTMIRGNGEMQ